LHFKLLNLELSSLGTVPKFSLWLRSLQVGLTILLIFIFLLALELITIGGKQLGENYAQEIIRITARPFPALFIGLLATAIIQSSSTITSSIVAMVASGILSLEAAIPMVMGSNIGTCVTSLIVALGNMGTPKAYKRGFSTASSHVIFNIVSALLFLPLEIETGILGKISHYLAVKISSWSPLGQGWFLFHDLLLEPAAGFLESATFHQPFLILPLSFILLFICIFSLTALFRFLISGEPGIKRVTAALRNPVLSLFSGIGLTAAIHSSSVTTSMAVMLAATEKVSPKKLLPFVMGANMGTTVTALIAAIGRSEAALAIAICHFLFNLLGVLIFFPFPPIRKMLYQLAKWAGVMAMRYLWFAFAWILMLFFALPFLVIFLSEKF
jgi:sodium-dependent phosphate cotransporter